MTPKGTEVATRILSDKGQGLSFPTQLDALLMAEFVEVEFLATDACFEGCTKLVDRCPTIFVNEGGRGQSDGRVRFTFAHEIGHYFLHRRLIRRGHEFVDQSISQAGDSTDELERDANDFASEVLLPSPLVQRFLRGSIIGLDVIEKLSQEARTSLQATSIKVARESSSRFCIFLERGGLVRWSAPSDDWIHSKLPWSRWHGESPPTGSQTIATTGSFTETETARRVWHPNDRVDDGVVFESALETMFGRLILVIDGDDENMIQP